MNAIWSRGAECALLVTASVGCQSIPDLEPFSTSTREIGSGLTELNDSLIQDLELYAGDWAPEDVEKNEKRQEEVAPWFVELRVPIDVARSITSYSQALTNIEAAGNEGRERAQQVVDAVGGLASSVGTALPGEVGAITTALYAQFAKFQAAKTFEQAVVAADPVIQAVAERMQAAIRTEAEVVANLRRQLLLDLENHGVKLMSDDEAFDSAQILLKRKDAQEELDELLEASSSDAPGAMVVLTAEESSSLTPEEREALALVEPRITASAAAREQVRNARARRMEELRTVLSSTELEWQLVRATQELIRTRYDRNELLVAKLEAAFGEWARAHGALVAGIEGTSLPDFESLAQTATEIQDVLSRPRN